jgi:hypothetical protein
MHRRLIASVPLPVAGRHDAAADVAAADAASAGLRTDTKLNRELWLLRLVPKRSSGVLRFRFVSTDLQVPQAGNI